MDGSHFVEQPSDQLDAAWYLAAYPQAAADIAQGRASDPAEHYARYGWARGYLPNLRAERPINPASVRSSFGGLWTDQGNALDLVAGKLELGRITSQEAHLLAQFITNGFVILKRAVPAWTLLRADRFLRAAYDGKLPGVKFSSPHLGFDVGDWAPGVKDAPAKALELHSRSRAVRDAIFAPAISRFLSLIFERPALASQTLGFWRGSSQAGHQDSAYVTYSLPMQFAASWIAFEDVRAGAGELFYYSGSHRLGDFLYDGRFKGISEGRRLQPGWEPEPEAHAHQRSLIERSKQAGHEEQTFLARRGDALIWAADLAHGGKEISRDQTRRSLVTHYCPKDVAPLYFEEHPRSIWRHRSGNYFSAML